MNKDKPPKKKAATVVGEISETLSFSESPRSHKIAFRGKRSSSDVTSGALQVLPRTRQLAKKLGIDLNDIKGTGPGGLITEEDVRNGRTS